MNKQEAIRLWKKATRHPEIKTLRRIGQEEWNGQRISRQPIGIIRATERHHGVDNLVIEARFQPGKTKRLITWKPARATAERTIELAERLLGQRTTLQERQAERAAQRRRTRSVFARCFVDPVGELRTVRPRRPRPQP